VAHQVPIATRHPLPADYTSLRRARSPFLAWYGTGPLDERSTSVESQSDATGRLARVVLWEV